METQTVENEAGPVPSPIEPILVKVVHFDVPFWSLVGFLIKLYFAAIPVAIITLIFWSIGVAIVRSW